VIFLTRKGSIQPFTQQLPAQELVPLLEAVVDAADPAHPSVRSSHAAAVGVTLQRVGEVRRQGALLTLSYTTIFEYLQVGCRAWALLGQGARRQCLHQRRPAPLLSAPRGSAGAAQVAESQVRPQHGACTSPDRTPGPLAPQYLRLVAELLQPFGSQAMFYLAAAVSDFYVPWGELTHHKIQRWAGGAGQGS
jgi:hypothetical protein